MAGSWWSNFKGCCREWPAYFNKSICIHGIRRLAPWSACAGQWAVPASRSFRRVRPEPAIVGRTSGRNSRASQIAGRRRRVCGHSASALCGSRVPEAEPMKLNDDRAGRLILALRQQGVTDPRVLTAMESVDRAVFVHERFLDQAWEDQALPIDCAQTISQPYHRRPDDPGAGRAAAPPGAGDRHGQWLPGRGAEPAGALCLFGRTLQEPADRGRGAAEGRWGSTM